MSSDDVVRDADLQQTNDLSVEETQLGDMTTAWVEEAISHIPQYRDADHTKEPECLRAIQALKNLNPPDVPENAKDASRVGEQIDEYRLLRKLGRGGMGEVYYAEHIRLGRAFALKLLHSDRLRDQELVARFEREMKAIGRLDHANIVKATGAGQVGKDLFLVMEYVDGQSLSEVLSESPEGRLSIEQACHVIRETCLGLEYVHERGMIHRDIKPANLMQDRSGRVRILDLGLARGVAAAQVDEELTSERQALGTVDYMAPEQIRDSRTVDHRTDIYALGATFYKLLTGRTPFADESHPSLESRLLAIVNEEAPCLQTIRPEVPLELSDLVGKMLARRPEDRPQSMAEIRAILDQQPANRRDDALPLPRSTAAPPLNRGRLAVAVAFIFAAVFLLAQIVLRLQTPNGGELLITAAEDVQVTIQESDGNEKTLKLTAGKNQPIAVRSGPFEIRFEGADADTYQWNADRSELVMNKGETFRARVVRKRPANAKVTERMAAADQPAVVSGKASPFDQLSREQIDPYELSVAGGGDASQVPRELVAIYGDSRWKAEGNVQTIALDQAGKRVLSVGVFLTLWDTATGKAIRYFPGSVGAINAEGTRIAAWSPTEGVTIWEAASGQSIQNFLYPSESVVLLHFRDDKATLLTVRGEGTVEFWDIKTGQKSRASLENGSPILAATVSSDGKKLAAAGTDNQVRIWDLDRGTLQETLKEAEPVRSLDFSPDGQSLLCAAPRTLARWQLGPQVSREPLVSVQHQTFPSAQFSPQGKVFAFGGYFGDQVQVWDAKTNKRLTSLETSAPLAFSPKGDVLATVHQGNTLRLWDTATWKLLNPIPAQSGGTWTVTVRPDGKQIAMAYFLGAVALIDVATGKTQPLPETIKASALDFSPNGELLAIGSTNGEIVLWDHREGRILQDWQADRLPVHNLQFSPDGRTLASCGMDGLVLWDPETGLRRKQLAPPDSTIDAIAFAPDGKTLVSRGQTVGIQIWNLATGELVRSQSVSEHCPQTLALSPEGQLLAWGDANHCFVGETESGGEPQTLFLGGGGTRATGVGLTPDHQTLVCATQGSVKLWSRASEPPAGMRFQFLPWKTIRLTTTHDLIRQAVITPDGRHVVTANNNGTVAVVRIKPRPASTPNPPNKAP